MNELQSLRDEVAELRRQNDTLVHQLRSLDERLAELEPGDAVVASRRNVLRAAGAAAAGLAAGALATSRPAAAATGNQMFLGGNNTSLNQTRIVVGSSPSPPNNGPFVDDGAAVLFVDSANSNGFGFEARGGFNAIRARGDVIGVASLGERYAFAAQASDTAAMVFGETATDGRKKLMPIERTDVHVRAELDNDGEGNLWFCVVPGEPGQWRKLAGPASAGSFHPVTPTRVYDSRLPVPDPGRLSGVEARLIRVADGRDLGSGGVVVGDLVPPRATAISGNLTIAGTEGAGFLAINEGGNRAVTASAINWSGSGQVLSNGFVVKLDLDRNVTVVVGGGGSTHVVIDITGYYL